jgi:hypothetical protein
MATFAVGHTFTEPGNSDDIIHVHYSRTWPPVYLEPWAVSHLVLRFICKLNLPLLAGINGCHTLHGPKSPPIIKTTFCPLSVHSFSTSADNRLKLPGGNWPITALQVSTHWQGYVHAFQLDRLSLHSELYSVLIVPSGFQKLAPPCKLGGCE